MILPPGEIKIKRKRSDEPVELLRIHEPLGKKQKCAAEFVFCRQNITTIPAITDQSSMIPITRDSELPSKDLIPRSKTRPNDASKDNDSKLPASVLSSLSAIPRHFHISHSLASSLSDHNILTSVAINRKRRADTIFMERKPNVRFKPTIVSSDTLSLKHKPHSIETISSSAHRPQKKPGLAARSFAHTVNPSTPTLSCKTRRSSGISSSWDVESDALAAQLHAYTLSETNLNATVSGVESPVNISNPHKPLPMSFSCQKPSRFTPKAPVLRYRERNPDKIDLEANIEIEYCEQDEDDDEEWIFDTYLRMSAAALEEFDTEKHVNFGFLVLDSQAEIEEFYEEEADSGDEDEEEDENAENHYTADYPDEEISSSDEFNYNAYYYSKDIDEFEADTLSDDDGDDKKRYPWLQKPWLGRSEILALDDSNED